MTDKLQKSEAAMQKIAELRRQWEAVGGGRSYYEGTIVLFEGNLGVVTHVHQGSEDPTASRVDIRLSDGKVIEGVSVDSKQLVRYRA
jgi:hypothetical protein